MYQNRSPGVTWGHCGTDLNFDPPPADDHFLFSLTVSFEWRRWGSGRTRFAAGVGDLQVPGLLHTGVLPKDPLGDGDLAGPPVGAAAQTHRYYITHNALLQVTPELLVNERKQVHLNIKALMLDICCILGVVVLFCF